MRLLRKITVQKGSGEYDGIEIELDFPEIMGMPAPEGVLDKLAALELMIRQGHAGEAPAKAPAASAAASAIETPAAPDLGKVVAVAGLLERVAKAQTRAELLEVNKCLDTLDPVSAGKVREEARARWMRIGG
jgi:hypothetical protein